MPREGYLPDSRPPPARGSEGVVGLLSAPRPSRDGVDPVPRGRGRGIPRNPGQPRQPRGWPWPAWQRRRGLRRPWPAMQRRRGWRRPWPAMRRRRRWRRPWPAMRWWRGWHRPWPAMRWRLGRRPWPAMLRARRSDSDSRGRRRTGPSLWCLRHGCPPGLEAGGNCVAVRGDGETARSPEVAGGSRHWRPDSGWPGRNGRPPARLKAAACSVAFTSATEEAVIQPSVLRMEAAPRAVVAAGVCRGA